MGKGGRGKKAPQPEAKDEDALLETAIAENKAQLEQLSIAKQHAESEKADREAQATRRDEAGVALTPAQICEKLDALPSFCIVNASRQFVTLRMQDAATGSTEDVCPMWLEPVEAKTALAKAVEQQPNAGLALGTIPMGKAFALSEGWATAEGATRFRLSAHGRMVEELRPMLNKQLEQQGLPTTPHVLPIFFCEELTTDTMMPVFLSRAELVSTWDAAMKAAGKKEPPPKKFTAMDLRILARRMQSGGMDWSIVRFVGTSRAYETVREAQRQEEERKDAEPPPLQSDPDAEPPPLESSGAGGASASDSVEVA